MPRSHDESAKKPRSHGSLGLCEAGRSLQASLYKRISYGPNYGVSFIFPTLAFTSRAEIFWTAIFKMHQYAMYRIK